MDELRVKKKNKSYRQQSALVETVNTMIKENLQGIDYVAINTDYQSYIKFTSDLNYKLVKKLQRVRSWFKSWGW